MAKHSEWLNSAIGQEILKIFKVSLWVAWNFTSAPSCITMCDAHCMYRKHLKSNYNICRWHTKLLQAQSGAKILGEVRGAEVRMCCHENPPSLSCLGVYVRATECQSCLFTNTILKMAAKLSGRCAGPFLLLLACSDVWLFSSMHWCLCDAARFQLSLSDYSVFFIQVQCILNTVQCMYVLVSVVVFGLVVCGQRFV